MLQTMKNRAAAIRARRRAKGVTLLELAMYLGIAGIIAGGVMTYYSSSSNAQKVTDSLSMLGSVQQTVRGIMAGSADYTDITTNIVASSNQLPRKWVKGTGATASLVNPFNGTVIVQPTGTGTRFSVALSGLPRDACTKLAVADLGPGVASTTIAATGTAAAAAAPTNTTVTVTAANTQCSGSANSIAWDFY